MREQFAATLARYYLGTDAILLVATAIGECTMRSCATILALGLTLTLPVTATAQETATIERQFKGQAGRDIRIGVYVNMGQDCQSGPLPIIRLKAAPANGKVTVKRAKLQMNNQANCLATKVPGYAAFYRSRPNFSGMDEVTLDIKNADGKSIRHKIKIQVEAAGQRDI